MRSPVRLSFALGLPVLGTTASTVSQLDQPRGRTAMLAGPGVLRDRAVDGLREFAAAANIGVANTWGAKGVFNWDSPHHLGTCGLQAHDFELLGFGELDLLWVVGLDPEESPPERYELGARVVPIAAGRPRRVPRPESRARRIPSPLHRCSNGSPRSRSRATSTTGSPAIRHAR